MTIRTQLSTGLVGAVVVAALVATGLGSWNAERPQDALAHPLAVRTRLVPSAAFFGDPLVAQVAVDLDSRVVAPGSVRVEPSFAPYVQSAPAAVDRTTVGRQETIVYSYTIQCVSDGCLPVGARRIVRLPAVVVTARAGGRQLTVTAAMPAASVASRLGTSDFRSATPQFLHSSLLPPPSYGASPTALALALTVVAGLLGAGAAVLLGVELAVLARRRSASLEEPAPLRSALAFVRDAARRPDAADRRKALELLAETLAGQGNPTLADTAERVAWAEPPPSAERALELADQVETLSGSEPS
jgi:hypothetical protein